MKSLIVIFFTLFMATSFVQAENILELVPKDHFNDLKVVHKLKYPYDNKIKVDAGYYYLYGDKFVNSQGIILSGSYFFTKRRSAKISAILLKSTQSDEVLDVRKMGITPKAYGPDIMLRLSGTLRPIYGKFIISNYVQRLFIGLEAGINIAREKLLTNNQNLSSNSQNKLRIGPLIGIEFLFPLSKFIDLSFNTHYFIHKKPFASEDKFKSFWGNMLNIGYRF